MEHRIAIIGVGAIAEVFAKGIAELPNATLVAASCRTRDKGEAFAAMHGCKWFADYETMLDEARPSIGVICTPSGAHLEPARACAKRSIHMLCEKPIEITTARIEQMIAAAKEHRVLLGGIFPQRFNAINQVIHAAASAGRFGSLACISVSVPWWREDAYYGPGRWQGTAKLDGGGAMMNQSIHSIDLMQWIVAAAMPDLPPRGNPVEEVFAYTAQRGHENSRLEVEDMAVAVLRFRNGALGQILASTSMYPGSLRRMTIGGRDGTLESHEDELLTYKFREEQPDDEATRQRFSGATQHGGGAGSNPMAFNHTNHRHNIAAFLKAIEEKRQPELDGHEAAKAVAIIEACYESARTSRPVKIG